MPAGGDAGKWTEGDSAIWHTLDIVAATLTGRVVERPPILTPFPPSLGQHEKILVQGAVTLHECIAAGDGSYVHSTTFVGGSGVLGAALAVGSLAGSAAGNSRRRAAAAADATLKWRPVDGGGLSVSTHGFYLETRQGLYPWSWDAISSSSVVGRGRVHIQGYGTAGAMSWILETQWAELIFNLWALTRHRQHPQLVGGGWLPAGWIDHARANGYWPERQVADVTEALGVAAPQ
jgi:hypothetical protein